MTGLGRNIRITNAVIDVLPDGTGKAALAVGGFAFHVDEAAAALEKIKEKPVQFALGLFGLTTHANTATAAIAAFMNKWDEWEKKRKEAALKEMSELIGAARGTEADDYSGFALSEERRTAIQIDAEIERVRKLNEAIRDATASAEELAKVWTNRNRRQGVIDDRNAAIRRAYDIAPDLAVGLGRDDFDALGQGDLKDAYEARNEAIRRANEIAPDLAEGFRRGGRERDKEIQQQIAEEWAAVGQNAGDLFYEGLTGGMEGVLGWVQRHVLNELADMFADFSKTVLQNLFQGSGFGNFLTGLFGLGGATGGGSSGGFSLGGYSAPGRADGGSVQAHRAVWVGERGKELYIPGQSGTIIPNEALGGGARITNITHNTIIEGNQFTRPEDLDELMYQSRAQGQAETLQMQKEGRLRDG